MSFRGKSCQASMFTVVCNDKGKGVKYAKSIQWWLLLTDAMQCNDIGKAVKYADSVPMLVSCH